MPLPPKQVYPLSEVARRWNVTVEDLGCYALEDTLTLSTVVNGVDVEMGEFVEVENGATIRASHGRRRLVGVQGLYGHDIWPLFKGGKVKIRRCRPEDRDLFIDVEEPVDGLEITLADLIMPRVELDRFESAHGLSATAKRELARLRHGGPGALPKYDWDAFWVTVCMKIHNEGRPETQSAMVRDLLDWFALRYETIPDESTVKKKVSRLWKEFAAG
jgi:hypothetical protein